MPKGSSKIETGCRDQSLPLKESIHVMKHQLYFAKSSEKWNSQGVAFIGLKKENSFMTYSKKYLITTDQFMDIVVQENNGIEFELNLNVIKDSKSCVFNSQSWYGNILYLGEDSGHPIFTFTAPWDISEVEWKKPSHSYLSTIINGLKKDYSAKEIYNYLIIKPGIKDNFREEELTDLL
ncbi:hypothetical protein [Metabacillus litoralis]|uniref:hypothetical protein n=1 Tax=Metabacillus litoralis TaxID=152268 RepID=UPI001CFD511F|nr:hypothetical protein [Metabacillus litoralis]